MESLPIKTPSRCAMLDISHDVQRLVHAKGWRKGALLLYSPHTTCGLTVNEGADPDVVRDMTSFFSKLIPQDAAFRHAEGNSDAHIKTSLFGPSLMLIVEDGHVQLGTWQHIYLCECDGPRNRKLWVQFLESR